MTLSLARPIVSLVLMFGIAACSSNDGPPASLTGSESDLQSAPSAQIEFEANGSVNGPATLAEGQKLEVRYSTNRSICPFGGEDGIEGGMSVDGGPATRFFLNAAPDFYTAQLVVPHAHHLALWFGRKSITNQFNCWDSSGGKNFVFAVNPR